MAASAAPPFRIDTDFHALPFRTGAAFPLPPMIPREHSLPRRNLPSRIQTRWDAKPNKRIGSLEPLTQTPSNRWLTSFAPPLNEPLPVLAIQFTQIVEGHSRFETLSNAAGVCTCAPDATPPGYSRGFRTVTVSADERRMLHDINRASAPKPFSRKTTLTGQNAWLEPRLVPRADSPPSPRIMSRGSRQELRVPRKLQGLLPMREHVSASGFSSEPFAGKL